MRPDNGLDATVSPSLLPSMAHLAPPLAELSTFSPFCQFKVRCGSHGDVFQPTAGPALPPSTSGIPRHTGDHQRLAETSRPTPGQYLYNQSLPQIIALMFCLKHLNHHQTNCNL